ncbi:hypothetical protein IP88_10475 [alpha proteobacterium AAP81b]|nr:hypothetical protein IP88_10475 [alpha proteobacterium AAP81b]
MLAISRFLAPLLLVTPAIASAAITILPASVKQGVFQPTFGRFTEVLPTLDGVTHQNLAGVYGVELRRGSNALNGDWEVGVGQATSNVGANNFNQGQRRWASNTNAGGGVVANFTLSWVPQATVANPTGLVITLDGNSLNGSTTVASPGGNRSAFLSGNVLKIYTKRDVTVHIDSLDGQAFNLDIIGRPDSAGTPTSEVFLFSDDSWGGDGFTLTGTIRMSGAGGGSGNGALFKVGSYVPEPASWALLIAGFGLTGAAMRRRRGGLIA